MIMSRYDNVNGRAAIRETWAGQHGYPTDEVVIKFSIGIGGLHQNSLRKLRSEQERFDDLLLLEFHDTYDNLTLKLLNSLTAAHKTYDFAYFYKGDDDTFVMLSQIYKELHDVKNKRNNYYWGYFLINITPHVKGKWKETNWYLSDRYFPYARGSGYVISGDLARHIAVNADGLQMYRSEDVSLASWIAKFDVERRNDNRFAVGTPSSPCVNGYLVYHGITVDNMKKMHQKLLKTKKPC
jgi:galactosylxylosylprotein 3-beta-galactosyltransferase